MNYRIKAPRTIEAKIVLPSSKSICNRVLILNALSYSPYDIVNLSDCDDTKVMLEVLNSNTSTFDIGAAGTAMRFLTAFLAKIVGEWTLTGSERMKNRPIRLLVEALNSLGAKIDYIEKEGYPPLRIYGSALKGGEIALDGGVSSQYISALLMIAPTMEEGLTIHLKGMVVSRPYILQTLNLMKQFGVSAHWEGDTITVPPATYTPIPFEVESDWSAASYWYAMAALSESALITLPALAKDSLQGDSVIADLFIHLGVQTTYLKEGVVIKKEGTVTTHFEQDLVNCPDLAQTLAVACSLLGVPYRLSGLQSLKIKETDRLEALRAELAKLGFIVEVVDDSILAWGGQRITPEQSPVISTYDDHRMAMAFAPAAYMFNEGVCIADPQVVTKSYPAFWDDLIKAGFDIRKENHQAINE